MFCFLFVKQRQNYKLLLASSLWTRYLNTNKPNITHYDVLNLRRNCTAEDIRTAFINLSKKYHPDVNRGGKNDPKKTAQFIEIREAYQILGKKSSREAYDQTLFTRNNHYVHVSDFRKISREYENTTAKPGPYYGVDGLKRVSNLTIVLILFLFTILGTGFEVLLVRNSLTFNRDRLKEISEEATNTHESIRADAVKYGNVQQIKRISERLLKNP